MGVEKLEVEEGSTNRLSGLKLFEVQVFSKFSISLFTGQEAGLKYAAIWSWRILSVLDEEVQLEELFVVVDEEGEIRNG